MYGIVNKAIEELVTATYGEEVWDGVKLRTGLDLDFFISSDIYDDSITFTIVKAISEELGVTTSAVLIAFGEWWITHTTTEKYGGLMEAGGFTFKDFITNLPQFHNRVLFIYPNLTPPEFKVSNSTENSIHLHYVSKRVGLQDFVRGLIQGIALLYKTKVTIDLLESRDDGAEHEIFKITW